MKKAYYIPRIMGVHEKWGFLVFPDTCCDTLSMNFYKINEIKHNTQNREEK